MTCSFSFFFLLVISIGYIFTYKGKLLTAPYKRDKVREGKSFNVDTYNDKEELQTYKKTYQKN